MTSIIIEYDLRSPGRNYDELYKAIKSYRVYAPITESTWFIKTDETCVQVRDKLMAYMDKNDRIFVAALTGVAAWCSVLCDGASLKKNLEGR
jgi:hypothetical protein